MLPLVLDRVQHVASQRHLLLLGIVTGERRLIERYVTVPNLRDERNELGFELVEYSLRLFEVEVRLVLVEQRLDGPRIGVGVVGVCLRHLDNSLQRRNERIEVGLVVCLAPRGLCVRCRSGLLADDRFGNAAGTAVIPAEFPHQRLRSRIEFLVVDGLERRCRLVARERLVFQ